MKPPISPIQLFVAVAAALPPRPAKPLKGLGYARVLMPKITPVAPDGRDPKERAEWNRRWLLPHITSHHDAALAGVACEPSPQLEAAAGLTFEEAVAVAFPAHVAEVAIDCSHPWDSGYKRTTWTTVASPELLVVISEAKRTLSELSAAEEAA